jgi:nucleotide-binding universal stress UspA family protein
MERILVAVDGSDAALSAVDFAAALAARLNAELILMSAVRQMAVGAARDIPPVSDLLVAAARFEAWADGAIRFASLRYCGDPAEAILRCSAERGADLIVLGRDCDDGTLAALLQQLVARSPCPVAVAP